MAHALLGYDGHCRNIHGHSYRLEITISGKPNSDSSSPKLGMVLDFGELKSIVKEHVLDYFDHCTVLNEKSPAGSFPELQNIFGNVLLVPYQPTCENILVEIRKRLLPHLPMGIELSILRLYETATSYAEINQIDI